MLNKGMRRSSFGTAAVRNIALPVLVLAGTLSGCRVDKHENGDNQNVRVSTPFGGLSVNTDQAAVQDGVGLAVYPGATLEKKQKGHDDAANVNLSFGSFHLGVKAVSYTTPDPPDKVLTFYRKELAHYGTVILCSHDKAVGTPVRTEDGLTCGEDTNRSVHVNEEHFDDDKQALKAGSKQHQHIVDVEAAGTGTKFGLVMLDLPGKLTTGEDKQ